MPQRDEVEKFRNLGLRPSAETAALLAAVHARQTEAAPSMALAPKPHAVAMAALDEGARVLYRATFGRDPQQGVDSVLVAKPDAPPKENSRQAHPERQPQRPDDTPAAPAAPPPERVVEIDEGPAPARTTRLKPKKTTR